MNININLENLALILVVRQKNYELFFYLREKNFRQNGPPTLKDLKSYKVKNVDSSYRHP